MKTAGTKIFTKVSGWVRAKKTSEENSQPMDNEAADLVEETKVCSSKDCLSNPNHRPSIILSDENNPWFMIGGSVTGHGHKIDNSPCQDSHKIEQWVNGWGVAVVSDGAGSAANSHIASSFLTEETARRAALLVKRENWIENNLFPEEGEWRELSKKLFNSIQDSLIGYSIGINSTLGSLHATLILIIYSPYGLLVAHVGDGRAGCLTKNDEWSSIINPFEGDQVGETAFMTLDLESNEDYFESNVINEPVKAFFALTDGCERVCWETLKKDPETGRFIKPNKPFEQFFLQTIEGLQTQSKSDKSEDLKNKWIDYLDSGHKGFRTETDDKTMVIGIMVNE